MQGDCQDFKIVDMVRNSIQGAVRGATGRCEGKSIQLHKDRHNHTATLLMKSRLQGGVTQRHFVCGLNTRFQLS